MADHPYLSHNQQDLLLAALSSQARPNSYKSLAPGAPSVDAGVPSNSITSSTMDDQVDSKTTFLSPEGLDAFDVDFTPELDFLDGDQSFDFENADLGGEMIGGLPGEKRKNPDEGAVANGDSKRQELQDGERSAKKPGRKPLTSEPTTKRKAQNRAAQRAFRERKEKHVKDLETKVAELEKASEADKHENGLLKAQVERQQAELKEYRKRLSQSKPVNRSPVIAAQNRTNSVPENNFNFDFPQFGALPAVHFPKRDSTSPQVNHSPGSTLRSPDTFVENRRVEQNSMNARGNVAERTNSTNSSISHITPDGSSPNASFGTFGSTQNMHGLPDSNYGFSLFSTPDNMHGFASTLPQVAPNNLGDLFSPSILQGANINGYFESTTTSQPQPKIVDNDSGGDSTAGLDRVFQFNGGSNASDSTSPSASSTSQWNGHGIGSSSCGTSPEPSYDSPAGKDKAHDTDFASSRKNSNMVQAQNTQSVQPSANVGLGTAFDFTNIDYSTAGLDPVLFGDYRDTQAGHEFNSNFFDDALNSATLDYGTPSNLFGILQSPQQSNAELSAASNAAKKDMTPSRTLMAECEKAREGGDDDYGLPSYKPKHFEAESKYISCNKIWSQLQSCPDFQEGKFDLDSLCAELRTKATCQESGLMVEKDHVERALRRLGSKNETGETDTGIPGLMFEASSWDNVMQKLSGNRQ